MNTQIIKNLKIPNKGLKKDTSLYSTGLGVLRKCNSDNIPCLLIELGFINHSTDRAYLQDKDYNNYIAKSVADGIEEYIKGLPYGK